jgi:hypothetical protein
MFVSLSEEPYFGKFSSPFISHLITHTSDQYKPVENTVWQTMLSVYSFKFPYLKVHSGVWIAQWYRAGLWAGWLRFESRQVLGIFLFTTAFRSILGPTDPSIQWVPGALFLGVKCPECEADYSLISSAEVKECVELYLHSSNTPSWCDAQLKHRDKFTLPYIS